MDASSLPTPRHAATVLLIRERDGELHALLLQRHSALSFMAGAWVFPGGALSASDYDPAMLSRLLHMPAGPQEFKDTRLAPLASNLVRGLYVCACRETFEETGVLLAQHEDGRPCEPSVIARLQSERAGVDHDPSLFVRILERERLYLDPSKLLYWSHWITPSARGAKRFDTRFFIIPIPEHQDVGALSRESDEAIWLNVRDLKGKIARGEMLMSPPTVSNLEDVLRCHERDGSLGALFARERERIVQPILPKSIQAQGSKIVLMPWDPKYASTPGDGTPLTEPPAYMLGQPSRRVSKT